MTSHPHMFQALDVPPGVSAEQGPAVADMQRGETVVATATGHASDHDKAGRTTRHDRAWTHSLDLQLIIGPDGIIRAANDAWLDLLGWSPPEVVGCHYLQFCHPDDADATDAAMRVARDDSLRRFEKRCLHKNGGIRWIAWAATHEDDCVYASGRDTTPEHEQAAVLARMEAQLRQSQKMEAIGQLTGGLAHDFNNYLHVIRNSLSATRHVVEMGETGPASILTHVARGERAVNRAAALTQQLLSFAREQPLDPKAVDLAHQLADASELIGASLPPTIAFELTLPAPGQCTAFVDPNQLDGSLLNLCLNARDAMPKGGTLRLSASAHMLDAQAASALALPPGGYVEIAVADTGVGMDDALRSRIFDPFFTTKPAGEGTGLGLSMVYAFVRQSRGQVIVESTVGQGTTMRLLLPCPGNST